MFEFLSKEWFINLEKLNKEATDLPLSPSIASLVVNFEIEAVATLHLKQGKLHQGKLPEAQATITINKQNLQNLLLEPSSSAVIAAFMAGDIGVQGDMSSLLALQSVKPTPEQRQLYKDILAMTQFE